MSKRIPILIGLILLGIALWLSITPFKPVRTFLAQLENLGYDLQLRARVLTEHEKVESPVAIIDIDDKSIKAEGRWPWPRSKLAELLYKLREQGVEVVTFDVFFPEAQNNIVNVLIDKLGKKNLLNPSVTALLNKSIPLFDEDALFIKSITLNQVVLAYGFLPRNETQNLLPPPLLTLTPTQQKDLQLITEPGYIGSLASIQHAAKGGGFINIFPDEDGIIRRAPLIIEYNNQVYPALALQTVMTFLNQDVKLVTSTYNDKQQLEGVQIGNYVIPTDARGFVLIPFIGKSYTFPYYSATDVLNNRIPKEALLGKIVFVGTSATGLGDLQPTSIQSPFPGVEIQATVVDGILSHHFYYNQAWTFGANVFLTLVVGLLAAFIFPYLGLRTLILVITLFLMGLFYLNGFIWQKTGLVFSLLMPVLLISAEAIFNILYGYFFETRHREHLKEIFGQYVPETHINEMLKNKGKVNLHGEDRKMTVMFADIRNFTAISETLSATELVDLLNLYFTPMTEIIYKYLGTIDKYIGDLIMAFWGAPLDDKEHATHAIHAALEMQEEIIKMRSLSVAKGWPEIVIGIGMNTGEMSVGDMGSRFRRNYTVVGDSVNLASRVEGLTKFYGVNIIVTEGTYHNQTNFIFRLLDRVQVKGKKKGVKIYEVIGFQSQLTPELSQELEHHHQALELYSQQHWDDAQALMDQLHTTYPSKKIYSIYLQRIEVFKKTPPEADWSGIFVHQEK
jgi:adenylate cyclase